MSRSAQHAPRAPSSRETAGWLHWNEVTASPSLRLLRGDAEGSRSSGMRRHACRRHPVEPQRSRWVLTRQFPVGGYSPLEMDVKHPARLDLPPGVQRRPLCNEMRATDPRRRPEAPAPGFRSLRTAACCYGIAKNCAFPGGLSEPGPGRSASPSSARLPVCGMQKLLTSIPAWGAPSVRPPAGDPFWTKGVFAIGAYQAICLSRLPARRSSATKPDNAGICSSAYNPSARRVYQPRSFP